MSLHKIYDVYTKFHYKDISLSTRRTVSSSSIKGPKGPLFIRIIEDIDENKL